MKLIKFEWCLLFWEYMGNCKNNVSRVQIKQFINLSKSAGSILQSSALDWILFYWLCFEAPISGCLLVFLSWCKGKKLGFRHSTYLAKFRLATTQFTMFNNGSKEEPLMSLVKWSSRLLPFGRIACSNFFLLFLLFFLWTNTRLQKVDSSFK